MLPQVRFNIQAPNRSCVTTRQVPACCASMSSLRLPIAALGAVLATAILAFSASAPASSPVSSAPVAQSARTTCPGTFRVLHSDQIGKLKLPAGPYVITTVGHVNCAQASALFTRFLQDWDGKLPGGWKVNVAKSGFDKAVANFRELSQLETEAWTNTWKTVQDRMQDNLANLQKLLRPK